MPKKEKVKSSEIVFKINMAPIQESKQNQSMTQTKAVHSVLCLRIW